MVSDDDADDDIALLLAPSTSLGGARPKASVRDQAGRLAIAKFPDRDEEWPVVRWEGATLSLAEAAGILVPERRLETVARKPVLVLQRFDRDGDVRVPFVSAMTAIGARDDDGTAHSYREIADALRIEAAAPRDDLAQLWRRIVFNVLVSNTDDHARNHGFLRTPTGWRLSPAYDLNPMPTDVRPRIHALSLHDDDATSSLELAQSASSTFGLRPNEARTIIKEVSKAVRRWREVARAHGITSAQIDRMASAFEHADALAAQKL